MYSFKYCCIWARSCNQIVGIKGISVRGASKVQEISSARPIVVDGMTQVATPKPSIILLVEDEGFVREVTCKVLESAGYKVLSTCNAAEAKRKFRGCAQGVELLLTDVVLPGRDGLALAKDLRAIRPALKTIFMSG
jgi:PleD family two-component response regulator